MNSPDVVFPNLNITINNLNQIAFSPFGFDIYWYGVFIVLGIIAGVSLALWNVKRMAGNPDLYSDFALIVVPACIVGTRLFYVAFRWEHFRNDLLSIFAFRDGGLAIYGAIIAAFVTALIFCKVKKISFFNFVDLGVIGLPLGQAIGRWGNFFNREVFGRSTDGLFAMQYRFDEVSRGMMSQEMLDNPIFVDGVRYIQVHPTFLYESAWNFATVILLYIFMKHRKFQGQIAAMYLLLYGIGRFWIESLRIDTDALMMGSLPISQVLSGIMAVAAAGFIVVNLVLKYRKKNEGENA